MTYFVKPAAKFRRSKSERLAPVWSFSDETQAIEFAKGFEVCWVDVVHEGKVIFSNYSLEKPKWMSEAEATVVREQNKQVVADSNVRYERRRTRKVM